MTYTNPLAPFTLPGHAGIGFLPFHFPTGGSPMVGIETAIRTPPAYPVLASSRRLPPPKIGSEVTLRMILAGNGSQAAASFLSSPASDPNVRTRQEKEDRS